MDGYISKHSEAKFTHEICPDCMKELYGDVLNKLKKTITTQRDNPAYGEANNFLSQRDDFAIKAQRKNIATFAAANVA